MLKIVLLQLTIFRASAKDSEKRYIVADKKRTKHVIERWAFDVIFSAVSILCCGAITGDRNERGKLIIMQSKSKSRLSVTAVTARSNPSLSSNDCLNQCFKINRNC